MEESNPSEDEKRREKKGREIPALAGRDASHHAALDDADAPNDEHVSKKRKIVDETTSVEQKENSDMTHVWKETLSAVQEELTRLTETVDSLPETLAEDLGAIRASWNRRVTMFLKQKAKETKRKRQGEDIHVETKTP